MWQAPPQHAPEPGLHVGQQQRSGQQRPSPADQQGKADIGFGSLTRREGGDGQSAVHLPPRRQGKANVDLRDLDKEGGGGRAERRGDGRPQAVINPH